ncbi:hypothetical protein L6452_19533 [Arctium lappa]|uniref:Uncharacterized protein n=1 Tax=Arctium lappa TaxID=4217 RepID=A0ACB9B8F6_ARCLA|nr:hypothetical protein L6452_19533 [Arctium lappa]
MGFHQYPQSTISTSFSNQISLSGEVITLQDCKQQEAEIREKLLFDKLNRILLGVLEVEETHQEGLLLRNIFTEIKKESPDLEKFIVARLDDSQVKVISELLKSCQEVDYDKQEIVQIRGLNDHLKEGRNFQPSCKLERFKVKTVQKIKVITINPGHNQELKTN